MLSGELRRVQLLVALGVCAVARGAGREQRLAGDRHPAPVAPRSARTSAAARATVLVGRLLVDDDATAHREVPDAAQLLAQHVEGPVRVGVSHM